MTAAAVRTVAPQRLNPSIGGEVFNDEDDLVDDDDTMDDTDTNNRTISIDRLPHVPDLFYSNEQQRRDKANATSTTKPRNKLLPQQLSSADIEICQRLDLEYERALEEREIGYNARYQSVRQSAAFILVFMVCYLASGTAFFTMQAGWDFHDALFFSIYTMTTVGYGLNDNIPDRDIFLVFIMVFIFTGIATLTIMVAQVYQCIALEATRAQHARDRVEMSKKGHAVISSRRRNQQQRQQHHHVVASSSSIMMQQLEAATSPSSASTSLSPWSKSWETSGRIYEKIRLFFRDSEIGRGVSIIFPFVGLIVIGAAVVGPMEGWTVIESLYFACVSLTTVGYGLYVPKNPIAIYFCIVWLPFSVGFMSLYLSNVASFYIRLSDRNIRRLEKQMRRHIKRAKQEADRDRLRSSRSSASSTAARMGNDDDSPDGKKKPFHQHAKNNQNQSKGFEILSADENDAQVVGTSAAEIGEMRRTQILNNSSFASSVRRRRGDTVDGSVVGVEGGGHTMQTMRDVIRTVKHNLDVTDPSNCHDYDTDRSRESEFMSIHSSEEFSTLSPRKNHDLVAHKPTFALRVLIQERLAEIIAIDIAGFQSHIEIKENTLSVTIDTLKDAADKWMIPRRARKAFRAVAFEALYFVGEHGLITRGADALFDFTPFEFHGLFSPFLAAMGDAQVMEGWLAATNVLADVDLRGIAVGSSSHDVATINRMQSSKLNTVDEANLHHPEPRAGHAHYNDKTTTKHEDERIAPEDQLENGHIELGTLT